MKDKIANVIYTVGKDAEAEQRTMKVECNDTTTDEVILKEAKAEAPKGAHTFYMHSRVEAAAPTAKGK